MLSGDASSPYLFHEDTLLRQGDILRNINLTYLATPQGIEMEARYVFPFPYAVVLSQACDLEQHYANLAKRSVEVDASEDKILDTILVCPAYPHEAFLEGKHIPGRVMLNQGNSRERLSTSKKLKTNEKLNRYHYLPAIDRAMPDLVLDFKRFHTVPLDVIDEVYGETYLRSLRELHREKLSQRFANYLSRIGLPGDSLVE